ncbi:hypothetical protein BGZ96_011489 [Linnemannia gamsii]|uniref:Uncharacterized protein n=1 Tax=Linnemannia gamsii TaxID=64522 RepID=A0ABQ7KDT7_9FUNG|nr:hypothetical protein BGZ96_011489 [Linnemannia gamsii]
MIVTRPATGKTPHYFKWNNRENHDSDDDEAKTVTSGDEEEAELCDDDSSFAYSQTGAASADSDDDDDDDDDKGLADFDAGDLQTPQYLILRTPGTATRMLNGIGLDGGNSAASPARSENQDGPRKLSDYAGFQNAWTEIHEIAMFEEDLEYAGLNESITEFLVRMHERKRKSEFAGDADFEAGAEFADALWIPHEQPGYQHLHGDKTPTDDTDDGDRTPKARNSSGHKNKKDTGGSQLIDMGSYVDYPSGDEYSEVEQEKEMERLIKRTKDVDNDNPSTCCTDYYDSDSDSSAGYELDEQDLEVAGTIGTTNRTGGCISDSQPQTYNY